MTAAVWRLSLSYWKLGFSYCWKYVIRAGSIDNVFLLRSSNEHLFSYEIAPYAITPRVNAVQRFSQNRIFRLWPRLTGHFFNTTVSFPCPCPIVANQYCSIDLEVQNRFLGAFKWYQATSTSIKWLPLFWDPVFRKSKFRECFYNPIANFPKGFFFVFETSKTANINHFKNSHYRIK